MSSYVALTFFDLRTEMGRYMAIEQAIPGLKPGGQLKKLPKSHFNIERYEDKPLYLGL